MPTGLIEEIKKFSGLFPDGGAAFGYGLESFDFEVNERTPVLKVSLGHYSRDDISAELIFKDAPYHSIMPESFVAAEPDENWEGFAFLFYTQKSSLLEYLSTKTLLRAYDDLMYDFSELWHYRVVSQNFIVDVVAAVPPGLVIKRR